MENKKIRVLYFVDRMLKGGIQSLIISWLPKFDEKIQIDFLLLDDGNEYELENEIKRFGCKIYKLNGMWIKTPIDFIKYSKILDDFFKEHHEYKVVHLHSSSKNFLVLKYAKKYGIPIRISHSHNIDFQTKNPFKKFVGNLLKIPLIKYSTDFFACSKKAGEWLFGKKVVNTRKFKVINNAIDYDKFKFDKIARNKIREKLKLSKDEVVIGHIGRFTTQKNHKFLIDVFKELTKINSKYKLILIGTGIQENKIKNKVKKLNLNDKVIFMGFQNNVNEYIQAMDLFIMPSLYEGLGIVLIEAQASGLPCYASENVIPIEAKLSSNFKFISLKKSPQKWAEIINCEAIDRVDNFKQFKNSKYIINDIVAELEKYYLKEEI